MGKVHSEGARLIHMLTDPNWLIISDCLRPNVSHWEAVLGQVFLVFSDLEAHFEHVLLLMSCTLAGCTGGVGGTPFSLSLFVFCHLFCSKKTLLVPSSVLSMKESWR